jgi:hypothetical protein
MVLNHVDVWRARYGLREARRFWAKATGEIVAAAEGQADLNPRSLAMAASSGSLAAEDLIDAADKAATIESAVSARFDAAAFWPI